ncbi:hypothetical protein BGZ60DRAFT_467521 [Tricladium varicosporioides]|nr:hypothetical protein BGZ60DRAFT_467521 [Hymenoscyphus varicosporioides]
MTVTERLIIPVQAGGSETWKEQVKFLLQTLKKQEGNIRTRWGPHAEDETKLEFLIGWEDQDAQKRFETTADFAEMQSHLKAIMAGKPTSYFVEFKPYAPKEIIDAAFVQLMTFSGAIDEAAIRSSVDGLKGKGGCTGVSGGWALSEVDGQKTFVAVAGWTSMDESAKATGTVNVAGANMETHHVNFRFPVKGFRGL